jgi:small subunit ribosomal protein S17
MAEKNKENKNIAKTKMRRQLSGVVVSDKMMKTIVVRVDRVAVHPKYKKRYTVSQKYKVHDAKGQFQEGDKVDFVACRPLSKDKSWRVIYKKEV